MKKQNKNNFIYTPLMLILSICLSTCTHNKYKNNTYIQIINIKYNNRILFNIDTSFQRNMNVSKWGPCEALKYIDKNNTTKIYIEIYCEGITQGIVDSIIPITKLYIGKIQYAYNLKKEDTNVPIIKRNTHSIIGGYFKIHTLTNAFYAYVGCSKKFNLKVDIRTEGVGIDEEQFLQIVDSFSIEKIF